jgi:hypothetical protein
VRALDCLVTSPGAISPLNLHPHHCGPYNAVHTHLPGDVRDLASLDTLPLLEGKTSRSRLIVRPFW